MNGDISPWVSAIRDLGVPVAIIVAIGLGLWRMARWTAPRLETWINRLVTSHEDLTRNCVEIGRGNAETLKNQNVTLAAQTSVLHRMETTLQELKDAKCARDAAGGATEK